MKRCEIACFIKTQLNLSYKKCFSRPILKEPLTLKALRKVYAIEFAKIIDSSKLIVNIDEVEYSKSTKATTPGSARDIANSKTIPASQDHFLSYYLLLIKEIGMYQISLL